MYFTQTKDTYIFIIMHLFLAFFILEGIMMKINTKSLQDRTDVLRLNKQFTLIITSMYCFMNSLRSVLYVNPGNAFVFYTVFVFVVYRKINQLKYFNFDAIYVAQCLLLFAILAYFTYTIISLYYQTIYLNFKLIGANKKIINAYFIRKSLNSFREAFILYAVIVTLYLINPLIVPGIRQEYKVWKIVYVFGIIVTAINEDRENIYQKILATVVSIVVFLDIFLERVILSIVRRLDGFAFDTFVSVILFFSVLLNIADLMYYGSGLKEFLIARNEVKVQKIE